MIVAICLDENNGMLFNNRRQSRDRAVITDLPEQVNNGRFFINEFSEALFSDFKNAVTVSNAFLDEANENDVCFVENVDITPYKNKINKLIVYKWNRVYPADFYFPLDLKNYKLTQVSEFAGSSHENITREVYEL